MSRPGSEVARAEAPVEGSEFAGEVMVRRCRFTNPDTGFAVLDCELRGESSGEWVVVVGPVGHLEDGERARVTGAWQNDRRFGAQVRAREAHPLPPDGRDALVAYLRRVRHIGPRRAEALIDRLGEDVLAAVDRDPEAELAGAGLSTRRAAEAAKSWDALRATRELHLLLAPHGLAYLSPRIHRHYGDDAYRVVRERPYDLTSLFGVGFKVADRIARGIGVSAESPARAEAALLHTLAEAERNGSTCLPDALLLEQASGLVGQPVPRETVDRLVAGGELATMPASEQGPTWVYRAETARLEAELAAVAQTLLASSASPKLRIPGGPPTGILPDGMELAEEQWLGVSNAFEHRLSLITGGPGTGKTAGIRMIGAIAGRQKARVLLVAPTGRAAKRMTEATGIDASTIHSALGWIPDQGPTHGEDDPLPCDLLIVDETSMASLEVLVMLLRAVGPRAHVVLVGDADQLAPVGAGKPFAELVESGLTPTARLQHIFRQAAGSMIVQGAHAVRVGKMPSFQHAEGMSRDLFMIDHADPAAALEEIVTLVAERLPAHYGVDPFTDIQVFAPVYRGELGIDALNRRLRETLNPEGAPVRGGRLRVGDKLMLSGRNLHDLGLMNGTLLRLLEVRGTGDGHAADPDEPELVVEADDGLFELMPEEADNLQLAYACSVHKGQGIELPIAVVIAHPAGGGFFLRRELLYTAMTRATMATVIVGRRESIARAVSTPDAGRRYSRLASRLRDELPE